ncbi:MAG: Trx7/PDZ domain-containing (seleno)protein [Planctomycetota bacterium]|jgi:serine protease Do
MVIPRRIIAVLSLVCCFGHGFNQGFADEKNRREQAVREDKKNLASDARWLYNDVQTGFEAAKKLGKPLLVVLRCVPCKACTGIDESVLKSKDLQALLDDFVCVRLINANDIDLSQFQFDYDLSFSSLIFHPEGSLIARYGSWQHQLDEAETSTKSLQAALQKARTIHKDWDQNKDRVGPKQGGSTPFKTPIEIPGLAGKYQRELNWEGNVVQSCVHCHQIGDAYRAWYRKQGKGIPKDLIYPMPDPITIGLKMNQDVGTKVREVQPGSFAQQAGFKPGDDITAIDGAPMVSIADIAWALHRSSDPGKSVWTVQRDSKIMDLQVTLGPGWRSHSNIASRVGTWQMRAMVQGGMVLRTLDASKRLDLGLAQEDLGLVVHGLGEYGEHAAAKNAGFRKGDIVLTIQGVQGPVDESQLIGKLLELHPKSTQIRAKVLREKQRLELSWPIQ